MDKNIAAKVKAEKMRERKFIPKQSEHDLQKACINWFRYQYHDVLIFSIPNGGKRNIVVAAKLKAEGSLSGVPDLCIPAPRNGHHGLYIEMKAGKNKATDNQLEVILKLRKEGYRCEVCYSYDDFKKIIEDYLN